MAHNKNTIFLNADYIVIEYIDIIKSPYLILLNLIRQNPKMDKILNLHKINGLNNQALYEWYIYRENMNFLKDLNKYPDQISDEVLDNILDDQLSITEEFYTHATPLLLTKSLNVIIADKMVKDVIIYHPHNNDYAKKDLEKYLGRSVTFMNDFNKVMDIAGFNSTYFLSDIENVIKMKDKGILEFSSVSLPYEYRYNKKNMDDFKYDFEVMLKEIPFKLSYFNTCSYFK